jgi:NhaP-type Na+/H+ or K+/H+ antiporter
MIVPLIFILILSILISRTAKKFNVSSSAPLGISVLIFFIFVAGTRGAIRVAPDEIGTGIFLAILMYLAVGGIIYAGAFMWMKKKSESSGAKMPEDSK